MRRTSSSWVLTLKTIMAVIPVAPCNHAERLKYDLEGHFLYSWGIGGDMPGAFWGVHGFSVDQEGNFYVAEVDSGRVQKFKPRAGANPAFLVGKPVYSAWK